MIAGRLGEEYLGTRASIADTDQALVVELTVLMPCLNEAETIGVCIKKAGAFLEEAGIVGEILIADNGSTDGSKEIAESLGVRVVCVEERGYGAALLAGITSARGRYVIMGDADDSYDFSRLEPFVKRLREGYLVVMGNRFRGGIAPGAMPPLHRYLGNPVLSGLGRIFFNIPVGDFHCGLRGFDTASIRRLELVTTGMEFASEMVVRAALAGYSIVEVPTTLRPDGRSCAPHLKTWRDGWRHLKFLLMYSPKWLYVLPGIVLMATGTCLSAMLWFGPLPIALGTMLDLNTFMAACFAIIAGVQVTTFGVIARYYASITGMLPRNRRSDWILRYVTTDLVVCIAVAILLVGLAIFGSAIYEWGRVGFGDLPISHVPRVVSAGLSLIVIAIQLWFGAFIIGILKIPRIGQKDPDSAGDSRPAAQKGPVIAGVPRAI